MSDPVLTPSFHSLAEEVRESWQSRLLRAALRIEGSGLARPVDLMGAVTLSVLAQNYDDAMPMLLRSAHPEFDAIGVPFLCSAARIARTGQVMADIITKSGDRMNNQRIFRSTRDMESKFRRLADHHRMFGRDRIEFFAAITNWVVADYRLDPNMNRADPDARRLTVH